MDEVNACDELARRILDALPDAQLVACGPDKRAIQAGWPALFPAADDLAGAALVGVIPASVGLVAVDVDTDGMTSYSPEEMTRRREGVERAIGEPIATCGSPSGGGHMFYRSPDGEIRNQKWRHGDVRGSRGYVIVWSVDDLLHAAAGVCMADAPDLGALPTRQHDAGGKLSGPDAVLAATEGERNETLYRQAFRAAAVARRDGATFDPSEYHAAGLAAGLDADEASRTIRSATDGAQSAEPQSPKNPMGSGADGAPEAVPEGLPEALPDPLPGSIPDRKLYFSLAELDASDLVPPVVLPQLAWRGCVSLLSANSKTGKTSLVMQAVAAMLNGEKFMGSPCGTGRIAVIEEMGLPLLKRWLVDNGVDPNHEGVDLLQPCTVADLVHYVDLRKPAIIIIDTLISLAAANGKDENSSNEMRVLGLALRQAGAATLLVHHTKKDNQHVFRGSGDIQANPDMTIVMTKAASRTKFDSGPARPEETMRPGQRRLTYRGRWTQEEAMMSWNAPARKYELHEGGLIADLINAVHSDPGQSRYHYVKRMNVREKRAYDAINEAVTLGVLTVDDGEKIHAA